MATRMQLAIDCADPDRMALFWAEALGYQREAPPAGHGSWRDFSLAEGDGHERWNAVLDPDGNGPRVLFHRVPEPKAAKNRLHPDLLVTDRTAGKDARRATVDAETARLLGAGAVHVRTVEDQADYFAVLRDPEGNEFCVC